MGYNSGFKGLTFCYGEQRQRLTDGIVLDVV